MSQAVQRGDDNAESRGVHEVQGHQIQSHRPMSPIDQRAEKGRQLGRGGDVELPLDRNDHWGPGEVDRHAERPGHDSAVRGKSGSTPLVPTAGAA